MSLVLLALLLRAAPAQPPVNQSLRYPLPSAAPPVQQPPAPVVAPPPIVAPQPQSPPRPQAVLFAPGQTVARVGDKTILYGDVAPTVNLVIALARSDAERQALEYQREALTRSVLQQAVQSKMLLMEFERTIPSELKNKPKERAEAEAKMRKQVRRAFDTTLNAYREKLARASDDDIDKLMRQDATTVRLALLMKERKLESHGELDAALREFGTSLEQQINDFGDYMMGIEAARKQLGLDKSKPPKEITHEEMLDYYRAHEADYHIPAKASFEILTARFSNFGGDRAATHQAIVDMGNAVFFGAPLDQVARKHSQEPRADQGGQYQDITPGSLASKPIDRAVFTLETGKLSLIIEDEQGFHIIRVKNRTEAGQISFQEAQPKIREAIEAERRLAEQQKYLTELRARTQIWTIYDPPVEMAQRPY
jgi:PPIC-type peptidyl-prolyl cis-trans isomerase-like protein